MTPETFARMSEETRAELNNALAGTLRPAPAMTPAELKAWRKTRGLNQQQLADAIGTTRNTVSRWEISRHPIPPWASKMLGLLMLQPSHSTDNKLRPLSRAQL